MEKLGNMLKIDNRIYAFVNSENKCILKFPKCNIKTTAYIGKNGVTDNKIEGDKKTPLGEFELGIMLGMHPKNEIKKDINLEYMQITENMYWVSDQNSKYYNRLVDISRVTKDWDFAEHLIDYKIQYEYLIEIKSNPNNIPGKGSAIFLHCNKSNYTEGCIAVDKNNIKKIVECVDKNTKICIIENAF